MNFRNRETAARLLLEKLKSYQGTNPIVAGIPRGAMPMAKIIAEGLQGELTAVLVHKIPHPTNTEFAIGCVGISGHIHRSSYVDEYAVPESYIQAMAKKQLADLKSRQKNYGLVIPNMADRIVIIVDDGIATGATTKCAIHEVRSQHPAFVVLAAAVSARDSAQELRSLVDDFVVLDTPANFFSVGQFFEYFPQVSDAEVLEALHGNNQKDIYAG